MPVSKQEAVIEGTTARWAKLNGILTYKFMSFNQRSQPDRMFLLPNGRVAFIEFKRPGLLPTVPQARAMQKIRDQGYPVDWFDDSDKAIAWLQNLMDQVPEEPYPWYEVADE